VRVVSINVGRPREVLDLRGRSVLTSIWKWPVEGPVRVRAENLEGDEQSDLSVHGGRDKSVYLYPHEHYDYWRRELPDAPLPLGVFGENLTTEGLLETEVHVGDRLRIGSAEFMVTQPRTPCFKLQIRFGREDMIKRFLQAGRSGLYVAVLRQGVIDTGDAITLVQGEPAGITIAAAAAIRAGQM